jgi:hypothetical protein
MPRTLRDTFRYVTYMGIFITVMFWWFSGNTLNDRAANLWMLLVFLPIFLIAYFVIGPRIPVDAS